MWRGVQAEREKGEGKKCRECGGFEGEKTRWRGGSEANEQRGGDQMFRPLSELGSPLK